MQGSRLDTYLCLAYWENKVAAGNVQPPVPLPCHAMKLSMQLCLSLPGAAKILYEYQGELMTVLEKARRVQGEGAQVRHSLTHACRVCGWQASPDPPCI
jgi:hypothetical protein